MGTQVYGYSASEHEYGVTVPEMMISGDCEIRIYVSAHGGGTVGEEYQSNGWDYMVMRDGVAVIEGSDLRSGGLASHAKMARSLASFLSAAGESMEYSGMNSEYVADFSAEERAFLVSEYERFGMFSADLETDDELSK